MLGATERLTILTHLPQLNHTYKPNLASIYAGRYAKQKNPQDKIYGAMGLIDPGLQNLIRPNYLTLVVKVYRQFTHSSIIINGQLNIIYQGSCMSLHNSEFPSWASDWMLGPEDRDITYPLDKQF